MNIRDGVCHIYVIHILCYLKGSIHHCRNPKHDGGKWKKDSPRFGQDLCFQLEELNKKMIQLDKIDPACI